MNKLLRYAALLLMWAQMLSALAYSVVMNPVVKQWLTR